MVKRAHALEERLAALRLEVAGLDREADAARGELARVRAQFQMVGTSATSTGSLLGTSVFTLVGLVSVVLAALGGWR